MLKHSMFNTAKSLKPLSFSFCMIMTLSISPVAFSNDSCEPGSRDTFFSEGLAAVKLERVVAIDKTGKIIPGLEFPPFYYGSPSSSEGLISFSSGAQKNGHIDVKTGKIIIESLSQY